MNKNAIYSDETGAFLTPLAGGKVRITLRVMEGDKSRIYIMVEGKPEAAMELSHKDKYFDYYSHVAEVQEGFRYGFRLSLNGKDTFYTRFGQSEEIRRDAWFACMPEFDTPDWAKGAVMYQIFIDRFCRGDESNDIVDYEYIYIGLPVQHIENWEEFPSNFDVGYFYGGDLAGVMLKLDYLKDLGVEVLYFNPLFVSPSNHKYDTQDYDYIDPHIGKIINDAGAVLQENDTTNAGATRYIKRVTDRENLEASNALFAQLVEHAHSLGIRVIIDGVFNHCGSFNRWMDREGIYKRAYPQEEVGAFWSENSPYRNYFNFVGSNYDGWWGHDTLPKLYYENSEKLQKDVLRIAVKWVSPPFCVDGWRLDVAADLGYSPEFNHAFWREFRKAVKEANPQALILAEHYGDPSSWLDGKQWDGIMNYDGFMEPVGWFLTGLEKHSDRADFHLKGNGEAFFYMLSNALAKLPYQSLLVSMNELSNHDHSRFLTRTNGKVGRLQNLGSVAASDGIRLPVMRQAIVMQMTLPGAPTIYYGDEAGVCGFTDPDNRRTYPWGKEDLELIEFHKYMTRIHRGSPALCRGSFIPMEGTLNLVTYARVLGEEIVIVVVYTGGVNIEYQVPVWLSGAADGAVFLRTMYTNQKGYNVGKVEVVNERGSIRVQLDPDSSVVLVIERDI